MRAGAKPIKSAAMVAALSTFLGATPALAECLIEGTVQHAGNDLLDPTGPALLIKTGKGVGPLTLVRLKDGRFLQEILGEPSGLLVRIRTDAPYCPTAALLADAGTALGQPQLIAP